MDSSDKASIGDVILLASKDRRSYVRTLAAGGVLVTHLGNLRFDDLVGEEYGSAVRSHLGNLFYLLRPDFADLLQHARHETTIIQPKDLGQIAIKLGLQSGTRVLEAGTGSGGLTTWLALLVGDGGQVYSYDRKASNAEVAHKNLDRAGVAHRVTFRQRDIAEGFDEVRLDALFLDVANPWDYLDVSRAALRGGGHFGALVPTMNQTIELVSALYRGPWFRIEVEEIWERTYKVLPARLRPDDRMVGHTGYLIFARAITRAASEPLDDAERETEPNDGDAGE